jgi:feruloyl esterase
MTRFGPLPRAFVLATALLAACAGTPPGSAPTAPSGPAKPSALAACNQLRTTFAWPQTTLTVAAIVATRELSAAGIAIDVHCHVVGTMNERVSPVDGKRYAIGFEMRLPQAWNGRFFYQANGGVDGNVLPAIGMTTSGPGSASALAKGFAVLSADAGHAAAQNGSFGIDPQARIDYGYGAVAALTPMAKALVRAAYGRPADRSYIGGCSNGGRHALVAAARMPDAYDGFLVGDPGTVLPRAAIANLVGGRTYAGLATDPADVGSGFTLAERRLVSNAVLGRCDALDGATDGMVQDTRACQAAFDLERDVPTCTLARNGTCLAAAQKAAIGRLFAGVALASGERLYAPFPYDVGLATGDWAQWKFNAPATRDAGAIANIWQVPPAPADGFDGRAFMRAADADALFAKVQATDATYTEPALSFMVPPGLDDLAALRRRGGRIVMYHGTSDPIFSSEHSVQVWEAWNRGSAAPAASFARLYLVPGMNHCRGGPATDQFDLLQPLVDWVENGQAPGAVIAQVRGWRNPAGANVDVPLAWSPTRTRPLCPYPAVARRNGDGDLESAAAFTCR